MARIPPDHPVERVIRAFGGVESLVKACQDVVDEPSITAQKVYQWRFGRKIPPVAAPELWAAAKRAKISLTSSLLLQAHGLRPKRPRSPV